MKRFFKKENILVYLAIFSVIFAVFLNVFYPPVKEKKGFSGGASAEEVGLKAEFKKAVSDNISSEVSGLSFGYLLGEKSALPAGVEAKMKAVGLAHIIVVSGTHLSIIIAGSRKVFSRISRLAALYFSIFLLILYVSLIGWTPSTVRASFVAILVLFAWFFGREQKTIRVVVLTFGFCLMINPYFLTNVSFQLSMLAYSGVVLLLPIFTRYFYGRDKPKVVGSIILSSLAAILMCLPIQLYYFGSMNLLSILANLLILPTIPYAMGFSFLTGVMGMLHFDFLSSGFGLISEMILKYHVFIISELENHGEFLFEFSKNNAAWLILYVPILILLIVGEKRKAKMDESS